MKITVTFNPWKLPSGPIHLEGSPSPEQLERERAAARAARAVWKPGAEAYELTDRLRAAVGHDIVLQGWDPMMLILEDEGPHPVRARCLDVVTREDDEGHVRAYLVLSDVELLPTPAGYDGRGSMLIEGERSLFGVHDLYELEILGGAERAQGENRP